MVEEVGYLGSNDSRFCLNLSESAKNTWVQYLVHTPYLPRDSYIRMVEFPHRPLHHMHH